jgi:hypothetical protein
MAMKEGAHGASLTDGRQITQLLPTDNAPGNASEKQDGKPSKEERPDRSGLFCGLPGKLNRAGSIYWFNRSLIGISTRNN